MTPQGLRYAKPVLAAGAILGCWYWAQVPSLGASEMVQLSDRFQFEGTELAFLGHVAGSLRQGQGDPRKREVREVNPSLHGIASWVSSVGAAVALDDLDGDGLPNDVCLIDPRTDDVVVAPVPGTGARYQPFSLIPRTLPYDDAALAPMGCVAGDFNEDGYRDVLVHYWGRSPVIFLRRAGSGGPTREGFREVELAPAPQVWNTSAVTQADVDGDGHLDVVLGNYYPDGARVLDAKSSVPVHMAESMANAVNGGRNRVFLWAGAAGGTNPTVQFREAEGVWSDELAEGWTLAVGAADLDGDGLPELYVANDFGPDRLFANHSAPGKVSFTVLNGQRFWATPKSSVLGHDSFKGMGVDFGDVNHDGILDIYVSNIAASYAQEESHFLWLSRGSLSGARDAMRAGVAPYDNASEALGLSRTSWSWDCRLVDFDADGELEAFQATGFMKGGSDRWPELHEIATANDRLLRYPKAWPRYRPGDAVSGAAENAFFVRAADGRFYDVAARVGLGDVQITRAIATADVDGDGDLDVAVANQWNDSRFYRNTANRRNSFLGLHLLHPVEEAARFDVRAGKPDPAFRGWPAVGAQVKVTRADGRVVVAQVDGRRNPDVYVGLGANASEEVVAEVLWRDRTGAIRKETFKVRPGWYTVALGRKVS